VAVDRVRVIAATTDRKVSLLDVLAVEGQRTFLVVVVAAASA